MWGLVMVAHNQCLGFGGDVFCRPASRVLPNRPTRHGISPASLDARARPAARCAGHPSNPRWFSLATRVVWRGLMAALRFSTTPPTLNSSAKIAQLWAKAWMAAVDRHQGRFAPLAEGKFHRNTMADEDRPAKRLEKRPCNGAGTVVTSLKFSSIDGKPVLGHSRSVKKANSCYQNSSRSINPSIIDQHTRRL